VSGPVARVLGDLLARAAADAPAGVGFADDGGQKTYTEAHAEARALAGYLIERGVEPGDRVLFLLENGVDAVVALFATVLAGAAYTFVNPQTKAEKLKFLLSDAAPKVVITEGALAKNFESVLAEAPSVRAVVFRGDAPGLPANFEPWSSAVRAGGAPRALPRVNPLDLAALIYTSGSTGRPKGVMMTHQAMMFSVGALSETLRLERGMRTLTVLPFSFNYGMYQMLLNTAVQGTLRIEASFAFPQVILEKLAKLEIQAFPGVPTIFARLVALHASTGATVPSMLRLTNTAAALSEDLVRPMGNLFPNALIFRMYGLTECKRALFLEPELGAERPGSVGKAMPATEVFLRTPDGSPPPPGEPGILHVRGPSVMLGYWNMPEESAKVLIPGRYPGERTFVTGDFFKQDADGYFYFLGRSDDIIKTRGEKVSPAEVEAALYALPGVREAAVVGVPDPVLGEAVRAYVALDPEHELTDKHVKRHCMARLEGFMVPRDVVFLPELPKTATGKIDVKTLRLRAREG
jgi:long-chain acyl-CoA synthetase